ncbi:RlpA-like double-psi beta-barrel-protein domain-containing protein-containing protein [Hysterangium stoloniferum]|nr:RlpA-like double-psi beta-barrel-protein domain-containing protein-containing protein [Hysterangium stoloniferum]
MFSISPIVISFLAAANVAFANPVTTKELAARQSFSGTASFYFQGGVAGACGQVHSDSDHIVALQTSTFANGAHCGASITITDTSNGVTATGIVADQCPGCNGPGSIDLSQGLFEVFAPDSAGVFPVTWNFN